jgi:hypothetical protein
MENIIGVTYLSNCFTYNKSFKYFTAPISRCPAVLRQLSADEMELGFGIFSEKTGNVAYFTLKDCIRDADDVITTWVFVPTEWTLALQPRLKDITVVITKDF